MGLWAVVIHLGLNAVNPIVYKLRYMMRLWNIFYKLSE
jgi:hypothetical protein